MLSKLGLQVPRTKYQPLRLSEDKENTTNNDDPTPKTSPSRLTLTWHTTILYTLITALTTSLLTISTLYLHLLHTQTQTQTRPQTHPPPTKSHVLTCGTTIAEAQRRGCTFDRLTKSWLPAECPRYYEDEFLQYPATLSLNISDWQYWTDLAVNESMTDEDMAVLSETVPRHQNVWVSTKRMHLAHCAFVLRRRADALDAGEHIDATSGFLHHANHCTMMLLDEAMRAPGIDAPVAEGGVGFGACLSPSDYLHQRESS